MKPIKSKYTPPVHFVRKGQVKPSSTSSKGFGKKTPASLVEKLSNRQRDPIHSKGGSPDGVSLFPIRDLQDSAAPGNSTSNDVAHSADIGASQFGNTITNQIRPCCPLLGKSNPMKGACVSTEQMEMVPDINRNTTSSQCAVKSCTSSAHDTSMCSSRCSFQFFVSRLEGVDLYVDLNSSPSEWITSLEAGVSIHHRSAGSEQNSAHKSPTSLKAMDKSAHSGLAGCTSYLKNMITKRSINLKTSESFYNPAAEQTVDDSGLISFASRDLTEKSAKMDHQSATYVLLSCSSKVANAFLPVDYRSRDGRTSITDYASSLEEDTNCRVVVRNGYSACLPVNTEIRSSDICTISRSYSEKSHNTFTARAHDENVCSSNVCLGGCNDLSDGFSSINDSIQLKRNISSSQPIVVQEISMRHQLPSSDMVHLESKLDRVDDSGILPIESNLPKPPVELLTLKFSNACQTSLGGIRVTRSKTYKKPLTNTKIPRRTSIPPSPEFGYMTKLHCTGPLRLTRSSSGRERRHLNRVFLRGMLAATSGVAEPKVVI